MRRCAERYDRTSRVLSPIVNQIFLPELLLGLGIRVKLCRDPIRNLLKDIHVNVLPTCLLDSNFVIMLLG